MRPLQCLQLLTRNVTPAHSKAKGNTGIKRIVINFSSVLPAFVRQVSHCWLKNDDISSKNGLLQGLSKKSVFEKVMRHNSAVKRNIFAFRPELCLIKQ